MNTDYNQEYIDHQRNIQEFANAIRMTRQHATYISLDEIVDVIKEFYPEEYKLIAEKLNK